MKPSAACYALIKSFEQCRLDAYPDPGTHGAPWTIGWGHTGYEVKPGLTCTQEQADAWLEKDVSIAECVVNSNVPDELMTQGMFDALVSMVYNIGPGAKGLRDGILRLKSGSPSTFFRKLIAGDKQGAAEEIVKWNKSGGQVMNGLTRRRHAELGLFLS